MTFWAMVHGEKPINSGRGVKRRDVMPETEKKPIAPYMAIGLSTVVYGIAERKHIKVNLETIEENIHKTL